MKLVNGVLHVNCSKCGLNTTHSTKHHDRWARNPNSFKLPATHVYVQQCAQLGPSSGAPPPPTDNNTPPSTISTGGSAGTITMDRATLESKLTAFERDLTDQKASTVTEAIRSLLLN